MLSNGVDLLMICRSAVIHCCCTRCAQGYQTADSEDEYLMEPSSGSIPKDIEGTFFRNGPGKFKVHVYIHANFTAF